MRHRLMQILSVALAVYILYVSGGTNIYHYCCDACRSYGHSIFITVTCEEVHSHFHCSGHGCSHGQPASAPHSHDDLCYHLTQTAEHCDVHHIDAPQLTAGQRTGIIPIMPLLAIMQVSAVGGGNVFAVTRDLYVRNFSNAPPLLDGRSVITLKNSYLI